MKRKYFTTILTILNLKYPRVPYPQWSPNMDNMSPMTFLAAESWVRSIYHVRLHNIAIVKDLKWRPCEVVG